MLCSFNRFREEIAASPHPAVLRTSTLPIKGRVVRRAAAQTAKSKNKIAARTIAGLQNVRNVGMFGI